MVNASYSLSHPIPSPPSIHHLFPPGLLCFYTAITDATFSTIKSFLEKLKKERVFIPRKPILNAPLNKHTFKAFLQRLKRRGKVDEMEPLVGPLPDRDVIELSDSDDNLQEVPDSQAPQTPSAFEAHPPNGGQRIYHPRPYQNRADLPHMAGEPAGDNLNLRGHWHDPLNDNGQFDGHMGDLDPINNDAMLNEYQGNEDDVNDPELSRIMMEEFALELAAQSHPQPEARQNPVEPLQREEPVQMATRDEFLAKVLAIFPGICVDYVSGLYDGTSQASEELIAHILDQVSYPKAKDTINQLKRKRGVDEDEEMAKKYMDEERFIPNRGRKFMRGMLQWEFSYTPSNFIEESLASSGYRLFQAYRALEEAARTFDPSNPPYTKLKRRRKMPQYFNEQNLQKFATSINADEEQIAVMRELEAARKKEKKEAAHRLAKRQEEIDEEENIRKAEAEGTMMECGCCCLDHPLNRMVHCNSDETFHWFCLKCSRDNAKEAVGIAQFTLQCMSMDGCEASFSQDQKSKFLDEKTMLALDQYERDSALSGILNLATCPFCPYAAECPPIEVDREFRCLAPDCEKVSCRKCRFETHIPKSCEEHKKENKVSVKHFFAIALSEGLMRKCNKCQTPFLKDDGCNKMQCTKCRNLQCYVCSKSCGDYTHFNDPTRGGKLGNCPLFENQEERHEKDVERARKEAMDKVFAEYPEISEEDLRFEVSEAVKQDEQNRRRDAGFGVDGLLFPPLRVHGRHHADNNLEGDRARLCLQIGFPNRPRVEHPRQGFLEFGGPGNHQGHHAQQAPQRDGQDPFHAPNAEPEQDDQAVARAGAGVHRFQRRRGFRNDGPYTAVFAQMEDGVEHDREHAEGAQRLASEHAHRGIYAGRQALPNPRAEAIDDWTAAVIEERVRSREMRRGQDRMPRVEENVVAPANLILPAPLVRAPEQQQMAQPRQQAGVHGGLVREQEVQREQLAFALRHPDHEERVRQMRDLRARQNERRRRSMAFADERLRDRLGIDNQGHEDDAQEE